MIRSNKIQLIQLTGLVLIVGSMLIQNSCTKDEFTHPVRLSMSVQISDQYKSNENLSFESGQIVIQEVQFEGKRETGEDYSFNTESGKKFGPQAFNADSLHHDEIAYFDLPQGIYTLMRWKFELSDGLERLATDDDEETDNETPGLILYGNYLNHNKERLLVRIEIDPFESFECQSITVTGDKNINILSGKIYNAVLYFDPYFAFRSISAVSLEDADYSDDEISPVLLISSNSNEDLYEIILYRLQQSAKIVVR
jgi:hypothetical protein